MVGHRLIGDDRRLTDLDRSIPGDGGGAAIEEPRHVPHRAKARDLLDHHQVQQAVVQGRRRCDARVVAELRAVGDAHEHSACVERSAVGRDSIARRHICEQRAARNPRVAEETAARRAAAIELGGDVGIEADAGKVHE